MRSEHDKNVEKLSSDVAAFFAAGGEVKQVEVETSLEVKIKFVQARGDITQKQKDFKIKRMREGKYV